MNIDRKLNLVVPVERADGTLIHVHASPISRVAFDQNFIIIAKAFTAIYAGGYNHLSGPRIAMKMLKKISEDMDQADAFEAGLLAEIRRLTNVIAPGPQGWSSTPLHIAIQQKLIDEDDVEEVENIIAFFIVVSAMHKKAMRESVITEAAKMWAAQTTSLNATAFAASLATSSPTASTGATENQPSIPS